MAAAAFLTLVVILFRVVLGTVFSSDLHWLHNFSPFSSVILCGAIFFPRRWNLILPLGAFFLSDLLLNVHYGVALLNAAMLPQYLALGMICLLGLLLRPHRQPVLILLASLIGSIFFYFITNTGAWLASADYAHNMAGWTQALTSGQPGYPSTLVFYRNTLVSDLFFTVLFLVCMARRPAPAGGYPAVAA